MERRTVSSASLFTPARGRTLPDIAGTIWVDGKTAQLHHLDYTYTRLPQELVAPRAGGHIEFLRVPSGAWIVRDWVIRMRSEERRVGKECRSRWSPYH